MTNIAIDVSPKNSGRSKRMHALLVLIALVILGVFNVAIYQKEQIIAHGQVVYLELVPADPRSLMQGDYMRLRFALQNEIRYQNKKFFDFDLNIPQRGFIIFSLDDQRVAKFVGVNKHPSKNQGEYAIAYYYDGYQTHIRPDSFLFQEGKAELYNQAKYGVFKFDLDGNKVLVGLADEKRKLIE